MFRERGIITPGRPKSSYETLLGIDLDYPRIFEECLGNNILEIGCGSCTTLADLVRIRLLNLSRSLQGLPPINICSTTIHPEEINIQSNQRYNPIIAANALHQPFRSATFDSIICLFSVPYYLPDDIQLHRAFIYETLRILKPNGKAYIYPIIMNKEESEDVNLYTKNCYNMYTQILREAGCSFTFENPLHQSISDSYRLIIERQT